ncbi:MAG TPA: hypothetical protein VHU87_00065 [Rhizomicrobium sp.]|jgi:hypothetical protein|nr:hypothetical protein [Rhizomicrobium sp.]
MDGLAKWRTPSRGDLAARVAALAAHPRYPDAARALAANMLAVGETDKALDGIFKDAGRYVATMWAIYLHTAGGLTLPRLKEVCASSGYLSPGRARALLLYLRHLGYFEPVTEGMRGAPARYAPTDAFVAAWGAHLGAALDAAAIVEPAVAEVRGRLHEPAVFECLARVQGEGLLATAQNADQAEPFTRIFLHRYAGLQILFTLLTGDRTAFPPAGPIPFSTTATARRFGVSRIHIKRLLHEAQQEGLVQCRDDGSVVLSEAARATIVFLYAAQIAQLIASAAATEAELSRAA